jgi:hypothetical protein
MRCHDHGTRANLHDRCQVFQGVIRQIGVQAGVDAVCVENHDPGVPIGRCFGDHGRAYRAGRARPTLNDDGLTQGLLQMRLQQT